MHVSEELIVKVAGVYSGAKIFRLPEDEPREVVFETYKAADDSWSSAVALIGRSELHFHHVTTEDYLVLEGKLRVEVGGLNGRSSFNDLTSGSVCHISHGTRHRAHALGETPALVLVIARPAWKFQDHILVPEW